MKRCSFRSFLLLPVTLLGLGCSPEAFATKQEPPTYCVPVSRIDLNPFRQIKDGKELAYLLLLRSYISTDPSETGILSSYEFSPDGKVFSGRLTPDLRWSDGSKVTAQEAAFGIAKALPYRMLGERVKIAGAEKINSKNWQSLRYSGIEILDERTFRLTFISDISNLTGVLREAFSSNSRHNRFWPIKIGRNTGSNPLVLAKLPQVLDSHRFILDAFGTQVAVVGLDKCQNPSFSIYPETLGEKRADYSIRKSSNLSAVTLQTNTQRLNVKEREALINLVREAFASAETDLGLSKVDSFFLMGEAGFDPNRTPLSNNGHALLRNKKLKVAYELPMFRSILEAYAKKNRIDLQLIGFPFQDGDVDAQVLASGIQDGRHIILQDILRWPHVDEFLGLAPSTAKSLREIAERSASTLPPDGQTLITFEKNAVREKSLAPIARRIPMAYTKNSLPVALNWTPKGELTFVRK